jgi:hypothetical protein
VASRKTDSFGILDIMLAVMSNRLPYKNESGLDTIDGSSGAFQGPSEG